MTNLKESCSTCPDIDRCAKAVENNINNMFLPVKKQSIQCVHFNNFEAILMERVANAMNQALMTYSPTNVWNDTKSTTLNFDCMQVMKDIQTYCGVKKIKMKPQYYAWFCAYFEVVVVKDDSQRGCYNAFAGIPIEIDDEINDDYEFVYKEN